jgi:hypothetical protein
MGVLGNGEGGGPAAIQGQEAYDDHRGRGGAQRERTADTGPLEDRHRDRGAQREGTDRRHRSALRIATASTAVTAYRQSANANGGTAPITRSRRMPPPRAG